mmetsp:Transcript_17290/g.52039  ORF Transcript_17290/g.52039 Transcript_17290/m.52039 type:complete len:476 (+) Transcript_17290:49-1476(+)
MGGRQVDRDDAECELVLDDHGELSPKLLFLRQRRPCLVAIERMCCFYAVLLLLAGMHVWAAEGPEDVVYNPLSHSYWATPAFWVFAAFVFLALPAAICLRLEDARLQEGLRGEVGRGCVVPHLVLLLAFPPAVLVVLVATSATACVKGFPGLNSRSGCLCDRVVAEGAPSFRTGIPADLTLAFVGDSGVAHGDDLLRLIHDEGASAVVFNGDAAYIGQNADWLRRFRRHLGATPFYLAAGGTQTGTLQGLQRSTARQWAEGNVTECRGEIGLRNACSHRGIGLLLSGSGDACGKSSARTAFFEKTLTEFSEGDVSWPICVFDFHSNERQSTGASGWDDYELCLRRGALVITSHSSPYTRTHEVDRLAPSAPHVHVSRRVESGSGAAGAGLLRDGHSMIVFTDSSGTDGLSADEAVQPSAAGGMALYHHGAFFCRFHVEGDPALARCYFKDTAGEVADDFYLRRSAGRRGIDLAVV